jgi:GNAT superfamily N-acetyltransferase
MPDPESLAALAAVAMPHEQLTVAELAHVCAGDGDEIVGDESAAAAWRLDERADPPRAWLLLVAVAPDQQRHGRGSALVQEIAARARRCGAVALRLADAVPRYLWPGVDLHDTRTGMWCEALGFRRDAVAVNMAIPTSFRSAPPSGVTIAPAVPGDGSLEFAARTYPHWVPELAVALTRSSAFTARTTDGAVVGFGCHSCNRRGWIGPMGTDPDRRERGIGSAVLAAVCADLAASGIATGEIAWVSNLRFYGKCGARVSRVFQTGALPL